MLHRDHERRLSKLEKLHKPDPRVPIYVEDEKDLGTRIDELIAAGALGEADRPRCVFWLKYRHYDKWQVTDGAVRRLQAQAAIWTPCATWLTEANHADASASADAEQTAPDGGTTVAC